MNYPFSIGITTYSKRFDKYLVPLVKCIKNFSNDLEVIVQVNGDYGVPFDEEYRKKVLAFCAEQEKVYPFVWQEFRSLGKLWNNIMVNSTKHHVLILNDDLIITDPAQFFSQVSTALMSLNGATFKINSSWSHFLANRKEMDFVGWFDERMLGIGNEDGDMQLRFEQRIRNPFHNVTIGGVTNVISQEWCLVGQEKVNGKYSKFNEEFFKEKWDFSHLTEEEEKEYWENRKKIREKVVQPSAQPFEKFYWDNKQKLGEK
jgi:hypothetical protein